MRQGTRSPAPAATSTQERRRAKHMIELLSHAADLAVQIFAISSMAAVGLSYTLSEILGPLRNLRGVILALVANFLAVPLLAFLLIQLLSLEQEHGIGLLLVAAAAGAPFAIKLTQLSGGTVPYTSGLIVLLVVVSIGYMPLVVPPLAGTTVGTWTIAKPLVLTMLLPLGVGLTVDALWPRVAHRLAPGLVRLANLSLFTLVVLIFVVNLTTVLNIGVAALLASVLLLLGSFAIGWYLGGFGEHYSDEMGFGTAHRNFAAAMVVADQSLEDPEVLVMVVVVSLCAIALLFPLAKLMGSTVAGGSATRA